MTPFKHHKKRQDHGIDWKQEVLMDVVHMFGPSGCSFNDAKRMAMNEQIGSQATLHYALHGLIDSGFLAVSSSDKNKREKVLTATTKAKRYLGQGEQQ